MANINIYVSLEELKDLIRNLDQCECEGYLNDGDPAYSAYEKMKNLLDLCEEL
jgi:hypothetical protein